MSSTAQATKNTITLKGSTEIVAEFFGYSINSILYQRGIYPPETFTKVSKYGLPMMVTTDEQLRKYLSQVLNQLSNWLLQKQVQKLVLVITSVNSSEVLERWQFDLEVDDNITENEGHNTKDLKQITSEIQAVIRQITASVTFLPLLNEPCTFDLLVYTSKDICTPFAWEESDPKYITQSSEVRLRSFSTSVHKVDTLVSYKD
ncbi:mitotic spindle assembly checkpoint protein MAD2 [Naegleria gruberi]|uniref:Mitotic spindle assembly checkpoint protein MAD2 n=1 Tax=Naegleria gruberi TaxID=5762 RepID=D2V3A0_NAEGR|nr:mitotic spindle assembly checkpoint protein MAD2 [Naegleria gruberi]EFC48735.1 mitotic spindle assembly checkpoint protein MAD2 [Naegleria gruberi]|eukprot:XP_002681479.1 mitotic spindle assembly checkpoint protein MAD2 [Naegleria gruberi strain NEG-M]